MNTEDREEFLEDLKQEARENEVHEMMMSTDFDYFLESLDEEAQELTEIYYKLKDSFDAWGWEDSFNVEDLLK